MENPLSEPAEVQASTVLDIGAKKVTIKTDLTGLDVRRSEALAMSGSDTDRAYARALYAICDVDGQKFDPKAPVDLDRVSRLFSPAEFDTFMVAYAVATRDEVAEEQVKKLVKQLQLDTP